MRPTRRKSELSKAATEIWGPEARQKQEAAMSCRRPDHEKMPTRGGKNICVQCARVAGKLDYPDRDLD